MKNNCASCTSACATLTQPRPTDPATGARSPGQAGAGVVPSAAQAAGSAGGGVTGGGEGASGGAGGAGPPGEAGAGVVPSAAKAAGSAGRCFTFPATQSGNGQRRYLACGKLQHTKGSARQR